MSERFSSRLAQLLRLIFGRSFSLSRFENSSNEYCRLSYEERSSEQTSWWMRRAAVSRAPVSRQPAERVVDF